MNTHTIAIQNFKTNRKSVFLLLSGVEVVFSLVEFVSSVADDDVTAAAATTESESESFNDVLFQSVKILALKPSKR